MRLPIRQAALACTLCVAGWASTPAAWESNAWSDFVRGRFTGVALTRDGQLIVAPRAEAVAATGEGAVWSLTRASDGAVWFGTGHRGRLYRLENGAARLVWTAHEPEIFALAPAADGAVYAATSPGGHIWRVDRSGQAEVWFETKAKYVWALAVARDGTLYAATGDDGRVHAIGARGQGSVYYETGQAHVTALAFDARGALLAGSEPNGNLYRITAPMKATVLYHAALPEIREVRAMGDGSLLVVALGGALAQKQSAAAASAASAAANQPAAPMTITVTAEASVPAQAGIDVKNAPAKAAAGADAGAALPAAPPPAEVTGVEKANLTRINPDLTTETLWTSKDENLLSLAVVGDVPYVGTDLRGRLYRVEPRLKSALVVETGEGEVPRLLDDSGGLLIATGTQAKLYRLTAASAGKGEYESPVHDAGGVARWGRIEWRGEATAGAVTLRTRSGNTPRPDQTWSEWSEALADPAAAKVASPAARYIQWRAELSGAAALDAVTLSYQPRNNRPQIHAITVTPQWVAVAQRSASASAGGAAVPTYSVTVSDGADASTAATSAGTPAQQVNRAGQLQLLVSWQADDADGDRLIYTLQVRSEGEREWKTLKRELADNTYTIEADALADGRYKFRVLASDAGSNPPSLAKEAELDSAPVVVDQTPPRVTLALEADGRLVVEAEDALSPVRRAEYSIDAGAWRALECADGVADSLRERFAGNIGRLAAGEHLVAVRVYDASGNAGLARTVVR